MDPSGDMTTVCRRALDQYVADTIVLGAGVTDDDDASDGTLTGKIYVVDAGGS